jgi:hypothetical protein
MLRCCRRKKSSHEESRIMTMTGLDVWDIKGILPKELAALWPVTP